MSKKAERKAKRKEAVQAKNAVYSEWLTRRESYDRRIERGVTGENVNQQRVAMRHNGVHKSAASKWMCSAGKTHLLGISCKCAVKVSGSLPPQSM